MGETVSLYSRQKVHCMACGEAFETDFDHAGGWGARREACSPACFEELQWRRALAALGKPYRPNPSVKPHCPACKGRGEVSAKLGNETATHACAACSEDALRGAASPSCQSCGGSGIHGEGDAARVCACAVRWS